LFFPFRTFFCLFLPLEPSFAFFLPFIFSVFCLVSLVFVREILVCSL
uniref:Uncharacterized protein n=1 Tax=Aegilops tauschii subsp. strangulata TaxID=200361 RepID=A0A453PHI2_AEGTS